MKWLCFLATVAVPVKGEHGSNVDQASLEEFFNATLCYKVARRVFYRDTMLQGVLSN